MYLLKHEHDHIHVNDIPTECPYCTLSADYLEANIYSISFYKTENFMGSTKSVDIMFKCPSRKCLRIFMHRYSMGQTSFDTTYYVNYRSEQTLAKALDIQESVRTISPEFVTIMEQCSVAEVNNLNKIVGLGYRKAFEFLIKDFIISKLDDEVEIQNVKEQLKFQILLNKYFENSPRILEISTRCAWLGNDQAHYLKKHSDHDVHDLKVLIHLVVNSIDNELTADKYIKDIGRK